jgi:hypothetical protein
MSDGLPPNCMVCVHRFVCRFINPRDINGICNYFVWETEK